MLSICLLLLFGTIGVSLATYTMMKANILSKVQVAILVPQEEKQTRMVVQFASTISCVEDICEFSYVSSEEQALDDLRNGKVQACIVFPDHFYEDVDQGVNTPAVVYVPKDANLSQRLFRKMLKDGVDLLQTSEAGVYAMFDLVEQYSVELTSDELGDVMLDLYIGQLFSGSSLFDRTMVSPFDVYSLSEYMFGGLLLLAVFLPGLCFGSLYRRGQHSLEQSLLILGIHAWKLSVIRVLIMGFLLWIGFLSIYALGCIVTYYGVFTIAYWSVEVLAGAFLFCLLIACVFHGMYALFGDERTGTIAVLLLEMILILGSGMLVPVSFLPDIMQDLCNFIHMDVWIRLLLRLLYMGPDLKLFLIIGIYGLVMFCLGVFGLWKHTSSGLGYS